MPGELFVEYQLAARAMRPEAFVAMAAYGDAGPTYIGTEIAYTQGGYEPTRSRVAPEVEDVLLSAMRELVGVEDRLRSREHRTSIHDDFRLKRAPVEVSRRPQQ
jgi:hypothetical protein